MQARLASMLRIRPDLAALRDDSVEAVSTSDSESRQYPPEPSCLFPLSRISDVDISLALPCGLR